MSELLAITAENFEKEVLQAPGPVLVDFGPRGAHPAVSLGQWWKNSPPSMLAS